ncbi:MAG: hypothetical protein F4Z96_02480 [Chloroflexi bacterium]|nr:hypothetical protein [Chloroflexota bacterium]
MPGETIVATEAWFRRRGTPHFIDGYNARDDILTRAMPFLTLFVVLEVSVFNLDWTRWINVLAVAGACAAFGAGWAGLNHLRGRPLRALPERVGAVELGVFLLVPPTLSAVVLKDWELVPFLAVFNLLVLAVVYVTVSFGLIPILRWAASLLVRDVAGVVGLFARALPLLLVFLTFLFINAEVWRMAGRLDGERFGLLLGLFALMTVVFALFRLPAEIAEIERFSGAERIADLVQGTPVEDIELAEGALRVDAPLTRSQWTNAGVVVLISLATQVLFVSVLVWGFFVVLGILAFDEGLIASWTESEPQVLAEVSGLQGAVVTAELLQVATFLAAFSGFYFTISVVTSQDYRDEFFEEIVGELRQAFAVRAVYLGVVAQHDAEA